MAMLTEKVVSVFVLVYKDGIAAMFGHDLKLQAKSVLCTFSRAADAPFSVEAMIDPRQVLVECARVNGHDDPHVLSAGDRREINNHIQDDVLKTTKYHEIRFSSTHVVAEGEDFNITGNLSMTGHTHQIRIKAMRRDEHYVASIHLNQPDFGIKPFSAAFGALKIKPGVVVEVMVPGDLTSRI